MNRMFAFLFSLMAAVGCSNSHSVCDYDAGALPSDASALPDSSPSPDAGPVADEPAVLAQLFSGGIANSMIVSGGTVALLRLVSTRDLVLHRLHFRIEGDTDASPLVGSAGTRYIFDIHVLNDGFDMIMGPVQLRDLTPLVTNSGDLVLEGDDVRLPAGVPVQFLIQVQHPPPHMEDAPGEFATDVHYYSVAFGDSSWFQEGDITDAATGESIRPEDSFPASGIWAFWVRDPNLH